MFNLYKKELSYYLNNPVGYIVVVLFAIFSIFLFVKDIFVIGSASMRSFFGILPWLMLIFISAISMRIISEEKRTNTIETLLTLPISETQIILAKFFALLTLIIVSLVLTFSLPISLYLLAKVYIPEIISGYIGAILMSASFISITMFFSTQTKNQVVAFLASVIVLFFLFVFSTDFLATVLPKFLQDYLNYLSPVYHLQNFFRGVIDFRSVFYFLSTTIIFLFLSVVSLEKRQ